MKAMHHPKVNDALREHEENRQKLCTLTFDMHNVDAVMQECEIYEYRTYLWAFCYEVDLTISIRSIEDITPVLRAFAARGYTQRMKMEKIETQYGGFKWFLHHPRGTAKGLVTIFGRVPKEDEDVDGSNCRLVQVGTRTEERPVYEVVCDDPTRGENYDPSTT